MEQNSYFELLGKIEEEFPTEIGLAIVIAGENITRNQGQRHTGFVCKGADGRLWLFHQGWHNRCRHEELSPGYALVVDDFLDEFSATAITSFLANVIQASQGNIPYSPNWDHSKTYLEAGSGRYVATSGGDGLTCATFVLESLKRYGFDLVNAESWPIREQDKIWKTQALQALERQLTIDDFAIQLEKVATLPRCRPEEAAAAASAFRGKPLDYETIAPISDQILAELHHMGLDSSPSA